MKCLMAPAFKLWAFSLLILAGFSANAQQSITPDALLQQAQAAAKAGKYNLSRNLAQQVLHAAPAYTDAAILIGNTYAWEQKYDSAQLVLRPLLTTAPHNAEVYLALAKVSLWSGQNPETILDYTSRGLAIAPESLELKEYKIRALAELQKYKDAYNLLETIPAQEATYLTLKKLLDNQALVNRIRTEYQLISFDKDFDSWHQASLEYSRQLKAGSITGRLNYANRFEQNAMQFEADYWPKLNETTYLYVNAGLSNSKLFPDYRAGLEVYRKLPGSTEVSAGGRALVYTGQTVWLYTGHIGKYFQKYWVSFRPFVQQSNGELQTTGILLIRRYQKAPETHVTLSLAKGSTPATVIGLQELSRLDASRIGLEGNFRLGNSFYWNALVQYEYEEYAENTFRNRFTTGVSLQYRFK